MIRLFDILISFFGIILLLPVFILVLIICWLDTGSPLFIQKRVGLNSKIFKLIKFRSMKIGTLSVGTHLISNENITFIGKLLRKYKIDELPQLCNVLIGEMSLVGPRPCLQNQKKLINERKKRGVLRVKPGITGLSQVKGIKMDNPVLLAKTDLTMIKKMSIYNYFIYILLTFMNIFK